VFVNLLRSPGIDSQPGGPVRQPYLKYWPTRLHRLAESTPWNQFLGSSNVYKYGLRVEEIPDVKVTIDVTQTKGIGIVKRVTVLVTHGETSGVFVGT
jgi:hypothetical protein